MVGSWKTVVVKAAAERIKLDANEKSRQHFRFESIDIMDLDLVTSIAPSDDVPDRLVRKAAPE